MSGALVERARKMLGGAERVLILTGAGVSAESGVPTFRGTEGLWRDFRPEQLATPGAFARDPRLVWEWYAWRRAKISACAPNPAHHAIARAISERGGVTLATQNVDGLHAAALDAFAAERGTGDWSDARARLHELHGCIWRARCTACSARVEHRGAVDSTSRDTLPACARCGSLLRPDIVWFGESLNPIVLGAATRAAATADVCLVVGTSSLVWPAAGLAHETRAGGGRVVEVTLDETPLTGAADVSIRERAGEVVPRLLS